MMTHASILPTTVTRHLWIYAADRNISIGGRRSSGGDIGSGCERLDPRTARIESVRSAAYMKINYIDAFIHSTRGSNPFHPRLISSKPCFNTIAPLLLTHAVADNAWIQATRGSKAFYPRLICTINCIYPFIDSTRG